MIYDALIGFIVGLLTSMYGQSKGWGVGRVLLTAFAINFSLLLGLSYLCQL